MEMPQLDAVIAESYEVGEMWDRGDRESSGPSGCEMKFSGSLILGVHLPVTAVVQFSNRDEKMVDSLRQ